MIKQISPLRQRMIDDMTIRNMSPNTQKIYISAVARFSAFHGCSLGKLGLEDIRDYHLHLVSRNLKPTSINPIKGALRFFYGTTLGQKHVVDQIPYAQRADTLPAVLPREEVERLLKTVSDLKMRTAFTTIYAPVCVCPSSSRSQVATSTAPAWSSPSGKTMKVTAGEFIRCFLLHVLPDGFNCIRHYGLFANGHRADKLALCRRLLYAPRVGLEGPEIKQNDDEAASPIEPPPCPCCGGRMKFVGSFEGLYSRLRPAWKADTS